MDEQAKKQVYAYLKEGSVWRWVSRALREGELFETYDRIHNFDDWRKEFDDLAFRYEKAGDETKDRLVKISNYLTAATYYHIGQVSIPEDTEEKKRTFYSQVRVYLNAGKLMAKPVERVEFPFKTTTLSGYFRKIPGLNKAPCVIINRGADASREVEDNIISEYFLDKGLFTFDIDCPGQYEARFSGLPMTPDFERPVAAALDYLKTRPDVDFDRVGIFGSCVGGYIAPRAASLEKRLKACVSLGGFYSLGEFDYPLFATLQVQNDMKVSPAEYSERKKAFNLEGIIEQMTCPLLVVNGSADTLMPNEQAIKIYEKARCPKELKIYEGFNHCVWYETRQCLMYIADWMKAKLTAIPDSPVHAHSSCC